MVHRTFVLSQWWFVSLGFFVVLLQKFLYIYLLFTGKKWVVETFDLQSVSGENKIKPL